jgi:hypothetical protein
MAGIRGACSISRGTNRTAGGGDETGDLTGPRRKIESASPGRAIPKNQREELEFLFSTAIADV